MSTNNFRNSEIEEISFKTEIESGRIEKSFEAIFAAIRGRNFQKKHKNKFKYKRNLNKSQEKKARKIAPEIIELPFLF